MARLRIDGDAWLLRHVGQTQQMYSDQTIKTQRSPRSAKAGRAPNFDAQLFLTSVGAGRSTAKYRPQASIFLQGDPADAVFYIEKGNVQLTVVSGNRVRRPVSADGRSVRRCSQWQSSAALASRFDRQHAGS